jgi:class 3 adenylate cyclase
MYFTQISLFILRIIRIVIIIAILISIFGLIVPYIQEINSYSYFKPLIHLDSYLNETTKSYVPTRIAHHDFSHIITIVSLIILMSIINRISLAIELRADKNRLEEEIMAIRSHAPENQKQNIDNLQKEIDSSKLNSKTRADLLKEFAAIKKELEKTGRNLSFLAIDVVGSTDMKRDEDPVIVENDFNEYHNFITSKFEKYGYIKAAWTPDGVMACFNTTEQAINAAQNIIDELNIFNGSIKSMKSEFKIRCGINSGFVFYDVTTPLEEFSDRVIDIAGHMQKHASPNTILIAKNMVEPVENSDEFIKTNKIVDSLEAFEWKPPSKE